MDKDTKEAPKPTPKGVRCVYNGKDKGRLGEVGYNDADNAYNKHWQRSTGFTPKPLPVKEDLPPVYSEPEKPTSEAPTEDSAPAKGKPGRKPKTT